MRGFKEDFDAWRGSLTPEEQKLIQRQAEGEFTKKYRKSDEFKQDLPEEKIASFSKVLSKFFENEAEDYKKEVERKVPNYNQLMEKAGDKVSELNMKGRVVEIDRDADRRYQFARMKDNELKRNGEPGYPRSSPMLQFLALQNNDTESHEALTKLFDDLKKVKFEGDAKATADAMLKDGVPPVGETFVVQVPMALLEQYAESQAELGFLVGALKEKGTSVDDKMVDEEWGKVMDSITETYMKARDEQEQDVEDLKKFFRSASKDKYQTKADVLKAVWEELPKLTDKPVPPIDEELLAELAEIPAVNEDEYMHPWGTADKLYKSEAIDAFGTKYLLGIFETVDEARKAFNEWNAEYEANRVTMREEMAQWSKQENARLDADTSGKDRIQKILDEVRR